MKRLIVFLVFALLVAAVQAQSYPAKVPANTAAAPKAVAGPASCPWLTEGSAAAALGGSVRVTLDIKSATQGSCIFTKKGAATNKDVGGELKIVVGAANVTACPAGSDRVVGVGTQANRCRLPHDAGTEMISGKVRAVNMAVTLSGGSASRASLEYRPTVGIDEIAEQVAGSLF